LKTNQSFIPTIPFRGFGKLSEIAHAVLYLASPEAAYIYGTELKVDAGVSTIR
tara:strand:+ start:11134 stop:11292 length:159 start_codon:yes stop_codon:yes gene_type:complete